MLDFPHDKLYAIKEIMTDLYGKVSFEKQDYNQIIELLKFDKKNSHGNINFVLLNDIGSPSIDCKVDNELIYEAFDFYNS